MEHHLGGAEWSKVEHRYRYEVERYIPFEISGIVWNLMEHQVGGAVWNIAIAKRWNIT